MLGFELNVWDYLTFVTIFLAVVAGVAFWVWLTGLPGRIAIARKHPEAEAVKLLGRPAADRLPLGSGVHLGVQADRDHRHPALSPRGSKGHRRGNRPPRGRDGTGGREGASLSRAGGSKGAGRATGVP